MIKKYYRKFNWHILFLKTFLYRIISFAITFILSYFILNEPILALNISIILECYKIIGYILYEIFFIKKYNISKDEGCVVWFTGLPCSGKSTIADGVARKLKELDRKYERLDGDIIRQNLSSDLGFSEKDRAENLKRVTFVSKLLSRNGSVVLASFISPYKLIRKQIRGQVSNFIEVYVYANTFDCIRRDVKGMWAKAKQGKIKEFTGHDAPYQPPDNPEILCLTHLESVEESVDKVLRYLKLRGLV